MVIIVWMWLMGFIFKLKFVLYLGKTIKIAVTFIEISLLAHPHDGTFFTSNNW